MDNLQLIEDKAFLLAGNLRKYLADDNEALIINDIVDAMDLNILYSKASLQSHAACHPAVMLKILIHAYAMGIFSSRRIQRALRESISFIYLASWQKPNFREIHAFRKNNLRELRILFAQFAEICQHLELVSFGNLVFDDRHTDMVGAHHSGIDRKKLMRQAEALLEKADLVDHLEDTIFGDHNEQRIPDDVRSQKNRQQKLQRILPSIREPKREPV